MAGLSDLPPGLRRYLVAVMAAGALVPVLVAVAGAPALTGGDWARAILLLALGAIAERFTLHLTHKTTVTASTTVALAAVLVFPAAVPGLLAYAAMAIGQLARRKDDPVEVFFNAGCRGIATAGAALAYAAARDLPLAGPDIAGLGAAGAVLAAALVFHALTVAIVAGAAGLQLGTNPLRVAAVTLGDDAVPEAAMAAMAIPAAYLVVHQPALVPTLALPLGLVHVAIREAVRLRTDAHAALAALVDVVELRDPYTAGHSRRVAELARALALRLGLTAEEADTIETAGRVHDVGKVAIDPAILGKAGRLTAEEFAEMRRHPVLGAEVVARFTAYQAGVRLVRHHHERWDGAGYPDGIAGEAIPLGARILAVADTYDALTTARPYRDAKPRAFALQVLEEGAGTQWDPRVVDALFAHLGAEPRARAAPAAAPAASAAAAA